MATREFSGKTKEEVIEKALETLKLKMDQVKFDFIEENSVLPFMKKKVSAIATYNEEDLFGSKCLIFIKNLLEKMNIEAKIYLIEENDQKVVIEIESPDTGIIIGKQGQTLEAIQTLANVVLNKNNQVWTKVVIDIENYRNRKERNLKHLANKIASQVKHTKKSVILEPMNPFERRIIHVTLQDDKDIETESIGEGLYKKIKVKFVNGKNEALN
jgi:spoIIIJ-associated protein